jgi:hypothetical protein
MTFGERMQSLHDSAYPAPLPTVWLVFRYGGNKSFDYVAFNSEAAARVHVDSLKAMYRHGWEEVKPNTWVRYGEQKIVLERKSVCG